MLVVTVYAFGRSTLLRASSSRQLSHKLYLTCPWWTHNACDHLVLELEQRRVITAPDFEAVLLPGDFSVLEARPPERDDYRPVFA